jgi:hypothetical protein
MSDVLSVALCSFPHDFEVGFSQWSFGSFIARFHASVSEAIFFRYGYKRATHAIYNRSYHDEAPARMIGRF